MCTLEVTTALKDVSDHTLNLMKLQASLGEQFERLRCLCQACQASCAVKDQC